MHGAFQHGLEMIEILGQLIEAEIFRYTLTAPRLGHRFKRPNQQLAGIFLGIEAGRRLT